MTAAQFQWAAANPVPKRRKSGIEGIVAKGANVLHNFGSGARSLAFFFSGDLQHFATGFGGDSQRVRRIKGEIQAGACSNFQYARIFRRPSKSRGAMPRWKPAIQWPHGSVIMRRDVIIILPLSHSFRWHRIAVRERPRYTTLARQPELI